MVNRMSAVHRPNPQLFVMAGIPLEGGRCVPLQLLQVAACGPGRLVVMNTAVHILAHCHNESPQLHSACPSFLVPLGVATRELTWLVRLPSLLVPAVCRLHCLNTSTSSMQQS